MNRQKNFGLRISDFGLKDGRSEQSAIRNPQSAIARLGLSLTEVLISMGIMTVGLLGVAAIFPVGSHYVQKGDIYDRASAVGQSAFSDLVARGALDPQAWLVCETDPSTALRRAAIQAVRGTYSRRYGLDMKHRFESLLYLNEPEINRQNLYCRDLGFGIILDPWSVSNAMASPLPNLVPNPGINLPFMSWPVSWNLATFDSAPDSIAPAWAPWLLSPPLRRATLPMSSPVAGRSFIPMTREVAAEIVQSKDDLALDLENSADRPSQQLWERSGTVPLNRSFKGDFSWLCSICPTNVEARNALGLDPTSYYYDVSVVVFYKRVGVELGPGPHIVTYSPVLRCSKGL